MPKQRKDVIKSYLDNYGEKSHFIVNQLNIRNHHYCLVIPAFNEEWGCLKNVWRNLSGSWLIILVVNSPPGEDVTGRILLEDIAKECVSSGQAKQLKQYRLNETQNLLTVDLCSPGREIDPNKGVGLARKTGADIALSLIHRGKIKTPLIFTTDADVELPAGYGEVLPVGFAAAIFPFVHSSEKALEPAINLYELALHYYVLGLRWAGSPYAFHSIGSTLTIDARHYAEVRGFPKRSAAEDFYILNKLAKTGPVVQLEGPLVKIQARISNRVPFGTGAALLHIRQLKDPRKEYLFYHPDVFAALKYFQTIQSRFWPDQGLNDLLKEVPPAYQKVIGDWCETSDLEAVLAEKRFTLKSEKTFRKFLHDWFDGFRTLKFIHFARDHHFPSIPYDQLLNHQLLAANRILKSFEYELYN